MIFHSYVSLPKGIHISIYFMCHFFNVNQSIHPESEVRAPHPTGWPWPAATATATVALVPEKRWRTCVLRRQKIGISHGKYGGIWYMIWYNMCIYIYVCISDMIWYVIHDLWYMIFNMWYLICDIWDVFIWYIYACVI